MVFSTTLQTQSEDRRKWQVEVRNQDRCVGHRPTVRQRSERYHCERRHENDRRSRRNRSHPKHGERLALAGLVYVVATVPEAQRPDIAR